jgi:proteic killer suppression protein
VVRSFRSKALKRFAAKGDASKLPVPNHGKVRRQLAALDAATKPEDMDLPGYRFHGLEGEAKRYAISVSGNYRLTWEWDDGAAIDVDLEDYH